jgi:hypothetical protein
MNRALQAAAVLLMIASCTDPPFFMPAQFPPLEGIQEGDSADRVQQVLGPPNARKTGWWRDGGIRFEEDFQVWYYAGKGRVILDGSGHVVLTQADPGQTAGAVRHPVNRLWRAG